MDTQTRYAEFTVDISTENVIKMHLNSFTFFGGYKETILLWIRLRSDNKRMEKTLI